MRQSILSLVNPSSIVVEVGVWKGKFSSMLLSKSPKKLILIDPWRAEEALDGRWYSQNQEFMDHIFEGVNKKFMDDDRVSIYRGTSLSFTPAEKYDLVYIDANHSYEYVKQDLEYWWPHIAPGGYLTGDDWGWTDKHCQKGPTPAIKEFCKKYNLNYSVKDRTQWIIKKEF